MNNIFDNIKKQLESIKNTSFWRRVFNWRSVVNQLTDIVIELQKVITETEIQSASNARLENDLKNLSKDVQIKSEMVYKKESEIEILKSENKKDRKSVV